MEERTCDIIVLGGGPAGMTAAIYAKRANLDVVLLETNVTGGLVNSTYTVENFPSYPEIHGMELMEKMREHVDHMGVEVEEVFEVTGLELGEDEKAVHGDGIVYKAPAIILATGRKPIALDVPTECDQMHFCAICDGAPYKGKRVLVVGGGNSAFDEGLYLLNLGVAELTVVEIMDRFFAAEATQDALLGDPRVKGFKTTKVVDVEVTDGRLSAAILENVQTGERTALPVDGIACSASASAANGVSPISHSSAASPNSSCASASDIHAAASENKTGRANASMPSLPATPFRKIVVI
mgnify:CR=1 FL=1